MISKITSKYQTNYKPLTKTAPTFVGDKDILLINDYNCSIKDDKRLVKEALGEKAEEYTIHTILGGKEGLEKAKQVKPFLTITAYNMRQWHPSGAELIRALKEFSKNIIVKTSNWYRYGEESKKAGIKKCENELGATKYVFSYDGHEHGEHEPDIKMFKDSVNAIINGKKPPKYPFQIEKETNK